MKIGVPREIKNHEYRVAITPAGVMEMVRHGHEVFIEQDAGIGSSISNEEYVKAGAKMLATADEVWQTGDMIMKVKEPISAEYDRMHLEYRTHSLVRRRYSSCPSTNYTCPVCRICIYERTQSGLVS